MHCKEIRKLLAETIQNTKLQFFASTSLIKLVLKTVSSILISNVSNYQIPTKFLELKPHILLFVRTRKIQINFKKSSQSNSLRWL